MRKAVAIPLALLWWPVVFIPFIMILVTSSLWRAASGFREVCWPEDAIEFPLLPAALPWDWAGL